MFGIDLPIWIAVAVGAAGALAANIVWAFITRSPAAWEKFSRRFYGKTLLIIGQPRTGKTTYYDWLRGKGLGIRNDPTRGVGRYKNLRDVTDKSDENFAIRVGLDSQGDTSLSKQLNTFLRERPDALLVFVDASRSTDTGYFDSFDAPKNPKDWVLKFSQNLRDNVSELRRNNRNLIHFFVVVGISDKISKADANTLLEDIDKILSVELAPVFEEFFIEKPDTQSVSLLPGKDGELSARHLTLRLGESFVKKRRYVRI